jgi:hypothetical protein
MAINFFQKVFIFKNIFSSYYKMATKLYVLAYMDFSITDFKIFASYTEALKIYLQSSITETIKLLCESDDDEGIYVDSDSDTSSENLTCSLFIYELEGHQYKLVKDYDIDSFQDYIESREDANREFLTELKQQIKQDQIPDDIRACFSE